MNQKLIKINKEIKNVSIYKIILLKFKNLPKRWKIIRVMDKDGSKIIYKNLTLILLKDNLPQPELS